MFVVIAITTITTGCNATSSELRVSSVSLQSSADSGLQVHTVNQTHEGVAMTCFYLTRGTEIFPEINCFSAMSTASRIAVNLSNLPNAILGGSVAAAISSSAERSVARTIANTKMKVHESEWQARERIAEIQGEAMANAGPSTLIQNYQEQMSVSHSESVSDNQTGVNVQASPVTNVQANPSSNSASQATNDNNSNIGVDIGCGISGC